MGYCGFARLTSTFRSHFGQQSVICIVARFEGHAALRRSVGAVDHARGPAGIIPFRKDLSRSNVKEPSIEDVDLLPERMGENLRSREAGRKPEKPGVVARLRIAAEDLLHHPLRLARDWLPGKGRLAIDEFQLFLAHSFFPLPWTRRIKAEGFAPSNQFPTEISFQSLRFNTIRRTWG